MKELNEKELLLLAYMEGELSGADKARAEAMLEEDNALQHNYRLLENTRLQPEEVVYSRKQALKRPVKAERISLAYIVWPMAVAASFALMILFYAPTTDTARSGLTVTGTPVEKENTIATVPEQPVQKEEILKEAPAPQVTAKNSGTGEKQWTLQPVRQQPIEIAPVLDIKEMPHALASIPYSPLPLENPQPGEVVYTPLEQPENVITLEDRRGWLAKTSDKITNLLAYLQKPDVKLDKKEAESGRKYWALIIEGEQYEVEGRVYTRR